jgi:hypothetical protein
MGSDNIDSAIPYKIDDPGVTSDVLMAIDEAATRLPTIPYTGHVLRPQAVGAVAKAIRKKFVRVAYLIEEGSLGASNDSKAQGPIIMVPSDYRPGHIFSRSIAVHEAIHQAVDGAGFNAGFRISRFEFEFIAHLGQACYALSKGDDITIKEYTKTCVPVALRAALRLNEDGVLDPKGASELRAAVALMYKRNYTINCNGWWKE